MISTKAEYLSLSNRGLAGNRLRSWTTLAELELERYPPRTITIRSKKKDSPFFVPSLLTQNVGLVILQLLARGAAQRDMYFQELPHAPGCGLQGCDGCGRLMNGEVMRDEAEYLNLIYGTSPQLNLRHDLERYGKTVTGVQAAITIQSVAGQVCYDALQELWDNHPTSIIEFTAFRMPVGVEGRPWVIWEVRDY